MRVLPIALLALGAVLGAACGGDRGGSGHGSIDGSTTVDFRLASLDGDRLGPQDFRGRIVLFDFWATWCRPCHVQADILKTIHADYEDLGVAFVAVSLGEPESTVRAFTERRPFPYPVLVDPADDLSNRLGIYVLPTVMILDAEGRIIYLQEGVSSGRRLRNVLEEATKRDSSASV